MLNSVKISGYKSIAECDITLGHINILIGANGAGKSNFISLFKLVQQMLKGNLQRTVSYMGGPDALLHFGRKKTQSLNAEFYFNDNNYAYKFTLEPTVDNRMMFTKENLLWKNGEEGSLSSGHFETMKKTSYDPDYFNTDSMKKWQVYHFHDTSDGAMIKCWSSLNDWEYLRDDASNLAAYLMYLKKIFPNNFNQIQDTVRLVAPFFGEFCLRINPYDQDKTELEWFEKGEDIPFRAYHLSDGTLRFMCLATLLLQPLEKQPDIIIIDEPELGLHPYAITVLASLIKSVSKLGKQVIISTQSVDLLSEFEPTDVIVVNREGSKSVLKRFDPTELTELDEWLNDYSLGELWKKNILGGRPA